MKILQKQRNIVTYIRKLKKNHLNLNFYYTNKTKNNKIGNEEKKYIYRKRKNKNDGLTFN